jgi:hypothetical protein
MSLNVLRLCSPWEIQVMVRIQLPGTLHEFVSRLKILKNTTCYSLRFLCHFLRFFRCSEKKKCTGT